MKKNVIRLYIAIFIVGIFVPALLYLLLLQTGAVRAVSEEEENRALKPFPVLAADRIEEFPQGFSDWFDDHLPFKRALVSAYSNFAWDVLKTSPVNAVVRGKEDWLFYTDTQVGDEDQIADYLGLNLFTEEELAQIARNFTEAEAYYAAMDAEFVIVICPNKSRVYGEYLPDAYGEPAKEYRMKQVVDYLRAHTDLKVLCPYEDLMAWKEAHPEDQLYFKYDTHWNNLGAYIGCAQLHEALGQKHPSLSEVRRLAGTIPTYDLARMVHLPERLRDDPAYILDGYSRHTCEITGSAMEIMMRGTIPSTDGDGRKLLLIGDSYATFMFRYVASHFNNSFLCHYSRYHEGVLREEAPAIVVYETVERNLSLMKQFSPVYGVTLQ